MGQRSKTTVDQTVEKITCTTDSFVPLVDPGLSSSSGTSSSSTSIPQDSSSASSSPATERSDEPTPGNWRETDPITQNQKKRGMANEIRTTVCEIFLNGWRSSQTIQRTQKCLCPHTFLRTQIRNVQRKWHQTKSTKHGNHTHFPKERNCEDCLRTKTTRAPCRRRTGEAVLRTEKFGDFITADHRFLNEGSGSRNNHRFAVVVQDLATQWIQSYPCKTKTSQEKKYESFWSRHRSQKLFIRTIHWNLANLVKNYHGIIELVHLIDPRRTILLQERYEELKKELRPYCYNQDWMKNGGLIR